MAAVVIGWSTAMVWDRRKACIRRGAAMRGVEIRSSSHPWACSSLASSDEFLSIYGKMLEGWIDWEKKNFESLVCTRCLQEAPPERSPLQPLPRQQQQHPGGKIVFPHIITRGSLVGKKVHCSTAINTNIAWQENSSQRIRTSMMFLNFYHIGSGNTFAGVKQTTNLPDDSLRTSQKPDPYLRMGLAMQGGEICSSFQPWAYSSFASSDKFLSFYDKVLGGWVDSERKNFQSLVCTRCLQEAPPERFSFPPRIQRQQHPGSKLVFPRITTRGSLVGKNVLCCRTAIHTDITWQEDTSQRILTSMMFLNFYEHGSDDLFAGVKRPENFPDDPLRTSQMPDSYLRRGQCRGLLLSLAGVAGMRLICPSLQLPFLEILLFFHEQLSSKDRATLFQEGGLWRLPLNLALAILRPFCGSLVRRCLTALLFISQLRTKSSIPNPALRCNKPDPYSVVRFGNGNVDHKEFDLSSNRVQNDDHSITAEVDDVAERTICNNGMVVSGGERFVQGCSKCVPIEPKDGSPGNTHSFWDQKYGFESGRWENSGFSIVDLELKDDERGLPECPLENSEKFAPRRTGDSRQSYKRLQRTGNCLTPSKRRHFHPVAGVFAGSEFLSGGSAQFQLEFPGSIVRAQLATDSDPTVEVISLTPTMSSGRAFEEQSEPMPVYQGTCNLTTIKEHRNRSDLLGSACTEKCLMKTKTNSYFNKVEGGECTYFMHEEPAEKISKMEYEACLNVESRSGDRELHRTWIAACEECKRTRAEVETDYASRDNLQGRDPEASAIRDASDPGAGDLESRDTFSSSLSEAISRISSLEHSEFNLVCSRRDSPLEASTNISLTCRLEQSVKVGKDSLAIEVVVREFNQVRNDGQTGIDVKIPEQEQVEAVDTVTTTDEDNYRTCRSARAEVTKVQLSCEVDELKHVSDVFTGDTDTIQKDYQSTEQYAMNSSGEQFWCHVSSNIEERYPEHPFADHPTCLQLRQRRHLHGDQTYINMKDLLPSPWGQLIFWHGRCKEGRPTLCVLLGQAVRQLPPHELKHFIAVTVSHVEYAELNYFKGAVKQMNILMDLEGLGFMQLPPMNILSSIGAVLNRDYAGRGGWIILVNAPVMLGFVIGAIQGVILRPTYNKGAAIDSSFRGFLEGKERIMMMGSKYGPVLKKHFEASMLPSVLGGVCACNLDGVVCNLGNEFLSSIET